MFGSEVDKQRLFSVALSTRVDGVNVPWPDDDFVVCKFAYGM